MVGKIPINVAEISARNTLSLRVSILGLEKSALDSRVDSIESFQRLSDRLKGLEKLLNSNNKEEQESAERFLVVAEQFTSLIPYASSQFRMEIVPVLINRLKNRPQPKELTKVQQRVLVAGGKEVNFEKMVAESNKVLDEERAVLQKQSTALGAQIDLLKGELKKLEKK